MRGRTQYVPYEKTVNVTTHEHRATTDESLKLLRKMREEVIEDMISTERLEFNGIKVVAYSIGETRNFSEDSVVIVVGLNINGKEHFIHSKMERHGYKRALSEDYGRYDNLKVKTMQLVSKYIAEMIAEELMSDPNNIIDLIK